MLMPVDDGVPGTHETYPDFSTGLPDNLICCERSFLIWSPDRWSKAVYNSLNHGISRPSSVLTTGFFKIQINPRSLGVRRRREHQSVGHESAAILRQESAFDGNSASAALAIQHHQVMVDRLPNSRIPPGSEPAVDGLSRWKAWRQHPPGDAAAQHVKDGVDDLPDRPSRSPPNRRSRWQQGRDDRPLGIGQVTGKRSPSRLCCAGVVAVHMAADPTRSRQPVAITS